MSAMERVSVEDCATVKTAWPRTIPCNRKACDHFAQVKGGYCPCCFGRKMNEPFPRPEVVVLCGSTKFKAEFERETRRLGLEGKIVLSVSMFGHSGDLPPEACKDGHPTKTALDDLHKRKIDLADRVLVINPGGYIGTSTRSEIEYAEWYEKTITYLECPHDWTPWRPSRAEGVAAVRACARCAEIETRKAAS